MMDGLGANEGIIMIAATRIFGVEGTLQIPLPDGNMGSL